jgi:hypothetical protein
MIVALCLFGLRPDGIEWDGASVIVARSNVAKCCSTPGVDLSQLRNI